MPTKKKAANPLWTLMWFNWIYERALWRQASGVAHGKLADIGTPRFIVWLYALTFIAYVTMLPYGCFVVLSLLLHHYGDLTYLNLSVGLITLAILPILGYTLWVTSRRVWDFTSRRVTGIMFVSVAACLSPIVLPAAAYNSLPTYCARYLEPTDEPFQPSQQLTDKDCFARRLKPLDNSRIESCAVYIDEVNNTVLQRPEVCQPGATPPPRSASTPQ